MFTPIFLFFSLQPRADAAPDVGDADDWQLHNSAFITLWRTVQISSLWLWGGKEPPQMFFMFFPALCVT